MKNILLCLTFLSMTSLCPAQKSHKNEASLGYFSAGEFFDTTAFKLSSFNSGKNISLLYMRVLDNNLSIGLSYTRSYFHYLPTDWPSRFENNTIMWREQKTITSEIGYRFSKGSISARAKTGIRYNAVGYKVEHYYYFSGGGNWWEPYGGSKSYGKLGAKLGASLQHPIIWRFFGELDCEYARMFAGADRNQLLLSYRVGFKF